MDEENIVETGFEDFEAGLFGDNYQIDTEEPEEKDEAEEVTPDTHDGEEEEETAEEDETEAEDETDADDSKDDSNDSGDPDTEKDEDDDSEDEPQMFTIKVNKKEEKHTLEEMTALAQKGSDYDRVKHQLSQAQAELEDLRHSKEEASKYDSVIAQLEAISRTNDTPVDELALMLRKSIKKNQGMSASEIEATIRAEDAEWKLQNPDTPKADKNEERYLHDLEEFTAAYPDVELTEDEQKEMSDDISAGMSMLNAYQKMKNTEKDKALADAQKEIKDLKRKLKNEKKNRENHYASPGSMSDSGGKISDDGLDDFTKGLFG